MKGMRLLVLVAAGAALILLTYSWVHKPAPPPSPPVELPKPHPVFASGVSIVAFRWLGSDERTEDWLGLYESETGSFALEAPKMSVKKAEYCPGDGESNFAVFAGTAPLFLVKGVQKLKAGPVSTVLSGGQLASGSPTRLKLGSKEYSLEASWKPTEYGMIEDYKLVLREGQKEQALVDGGGITDGRHSITWAGDLDDDGGLDLFLCGAEGAFCSLYLSSFSEGGELIRYVADDELTNC